MHSATGCTKAFFPFSPQGAPNPPSRCALACAPPRHLDCGGCRPEPSSSHLSNDPARKTLQACVSVAGEQGRLDHPPIRRLSSITTDRLSLSLSQSRIRIPRSRPASRIIMARPCVHRPQRRPRMCSGPEAAPGSVVSPRWCPLSHPRPGHAPVVLITTIMCVILGFHAGGAHGLDNATATAEDPARGDDHRHPVNATVRTPTVPHTQQACLPVVVVCT